MSLVRPFILTKIIATIGPACAEPSVLVRLIEEGVRVVRINFSHGGFEDFERSLEAVREASRRTGVPVGVLGDLSGPKIRMKGVSGDGVTLEVGDRVVFHRADEGRTVSGDRAVAGFVTTYRAFVDDVQPGHRVLIDDGAVRMLVVEAEGSGVGRRLVCNVTAGGQVSAAKGINLPDSQVSAPSLTEHDRRCVDWAVRHELDYLAMSFVRRAQDVRQLKALLSEVGGEAGAAVPVIAKIEKPQALDELEPIIAAADGVMVARGDLGVEMDLAQVPVIQKRIIAMTHDHGKPVIVATQMLQSMIEAPWPTRAEVSDVANAIYDGADAVMLSGETAVGRYPVQAVHLMARIAGTTLKDLAVRPGLMGRPPRKLQESHYRTAALAHGVNTVVRDLDAKLIGIWSQQGGGARYLSQNHPTIPIIAASSDTAVLRRMSLLFAVTPVGMDKPANVGEFAEKIDRLISRRGWGQPGEQVVLVAGEPIGIPGVTNTLTIHCLAGGGGEGPGEG